MFDNLPLFMFSTLHSLSLSLSFSLSLSLSLFLSLSLSLSLSFSLSLSLSHFLSLSLSLSLSLFLSLSLSLCLCLSHFLLPHHWSAAYVWSTIAEDVKGLDPFESKCQPPSAQCPGRHCASPTTSVSEHLEVVLRQTSVAYDGCLSAAYGGIPLMDRNVLAASKYSSIVSLLVFPEWSIVFNQTLAATSRLNASWYRQSSFNEITNTSQYARIYDYFMDHYGDGISQSEKPAGLWVRDNFTDPRLSDEERWNNDEVFAQERLMGVNPLQLERVTKSGSVGVTWSALRGSLNATFDWNRAIQIVLGAESSVDKVRREKWNNDNFFSNSFFSSHQQSVLQSTTDCWCDEKKELAMNTQQELTRIIFFVGNGMSFKIPLQTYKMYAKLFLKGHEQVDECWLQQASTKQIIIIQFLMMFDAYHRLTCSQATKSYPDLFNFLCFCQAITTNQLYVVRYPLLAKVTGDVNASGAYRGRRMMAPIAFFVSTNNEKSPFLPVAIQLGHFRECSYTEANW